MTSMKSSFALPQADTSAVRDLTSQQAAVSRLTKTTDPAVADKTAREFEAMVLTQMLQPMFAGLKIGEGTFGGGHAEEVFHTMLVEEYGKVIAKAGGMGIADMVRREMLKAQEDGPVAPPQGSYATPARAPVAAAITPAAEKSTTST